MSYRGLGFLDDQAQELASYAADMMEAEMRQRLPGIIQGLQPSLQSSINQLQPTINAAATKAMKAAMQDEAFKAAVAGTEGKIMTYGIVGGLGVVVATSLLTWWLVKGLAMARRTYLDKKGYYRFDDTDELVHRAVMARHLGRKITNEEIVDHINGVRTDNRISNLRLVPDRWSHAAASGLTTKGEKLPHWKPRPYKKGGRKKKYGVKDWRDR